MGKKQKVKFLKWSVWEAKSKGISSTNLEYTVSAHTASKSTRPVSQCIRVFFVILIWRLMGAMSTFSFEF
jgi:hypothetical protein